ncbi:hypothetical protein CUMW_090690 [Citrus unshiu]|nr:hypothetical protein CUMW_090690 [Citrus unshiu]
MENIKNIDSEKQKSSDEIPSLIKFISSNELEGFDSVKGNRNLNNHGPESFSERLRQPAMVTDIAHGQGLSEESHRGNHRRVLSISMPSSPSEVEMKNPKSVLFDLKGASDSSAAANELPRYPKSHSQPMPKGFVHGEAVHQQSFTHHPSLSGFKDKRFDSFKTFSGRLERQLTNLRGKSRESGPENSASRKKTETETNVPVDRYFDALQGPELDTLRPSDFVENHSHLSLYKVSSHKTRNKYRPVVHLCCSCYQYIFDLPYEIRREYYHPIRVNFFFAPWVALLFLALGVPPSIHEKLPEWLWYVLMTPIFCLELKIYGQWMSGGQRRLSKVANPSNHLAVVGNFVGALLGATMGIKEGPILFFAIGLAHYTVLFVTLYQRLPTNETLPKELHPVFFLFVAAPSVASMAWAKMQGSFNYGSRIAYFIALFLYFSLAVRINFFRGFKFSLAWWAYTFPMTGAAIATIRYSNEVTSGVTQALAVILSVISTLTVTALLVTTILHAFVLRDLFPNDIAIAISKRKPKHHHHHHNYLKWLNRRHGSSDHNDIENFLKFSYPEEKDLEACENPSRSNGKESSDSTSSPTT